MLFFIHHDKPAEQRPRLTLEEERVINEMGMEQMRSAGYPEEEIQEIMGTDYIPPE